MSSRAYCVILICHALFSFSHLFSSHSAASFFRSSQMSHPNQHLCLFPFLTLLSFHLFPVTLSHLQLNKCTPAPLLFCCHVMRGSRRQGEQMYKLCLTHFLNRLIHHNHQCSHSSRLPIPMTTRVSTAKGVQGKMKGRWRESNTLPHAVRSADDSKIKVEEIILACKNRGLEA